MMNFKRERINDFVVYFVLFVSGAAALIYEISWTRQIGLLFGHTIHAASIVLASYFAGMAVGYLLGAKYSKRIHPLFGYAVAELVVALWAFVIPVLIALSESPDYSNWLTHSSVVWQTTLRATFVFFLLLPATVALGFTLPMIAGYFTGRGTNGLSTLKNATRVTFAYSMNTVGAMVGVIVVTLYMMVNIGVTRSSYVGALFSIFCALIAIVVACRVRWAPDAAAESCIDDRQENVSLRRRAVLLSSISGLGILALQVLYMRMFSLVFHNSTYTFGIIVAVFLGALAVGSSLVSWLHRKFELKFLLGVATGLGAICAAASVIVFVVATDLQYFKSGDSFGHYIFGATLLVSAVTGPAVVCLGMILPLVWIMAGRLGNSGRVVGELTAANTTASALGALIASFLLLPWLGIWGSFVAISLLFFATSIVALIDCRRPKWAALLTLFFGVVAVIALRSPTESAIDQQRRNERTVRRWNSAYGWIDLVQHQKNGAYKIRQNLHYRFGKTGGNSREFRQAHIPLLLHPNPKEVLFMGLGTGLTAGGAIPHPETETVSAVELIPEVVFAVRELAEFNNNVVDHPKTKIFVDDARHHLLASSKKYDVIVSDLFVPWESETGYLYTQEHYRISKQRLKENGLFCQWLPLYQLGEREFELIANSFASEFPHTTIWWGQMSKSSPIVALIGSTTQIEIDSKQLEKRLKTLFEKTSFDPLIATPSLIWDRYAGDWSQNPDALLNTDEHPRIEFLTPISNRNRLMVSGKRFESYYHRVFESLSESSISIDLPEEKRKGKKGRQRFKLFRQ